MDFIIAEMHVVYSFDKGVAFMSGRIYLGNDKLEVEGYFLREGEGGVLI